MSTLRISNIEAKSVPASATVDEKVKITNSSGDTLVFIDGKTSGITTVGINTTDSNITFDANSNIVVTGIITATRFSGQITPTSLEIGSNIKLGNAGVITATSFVGDGSNLTGITQTTINNNADNRVITGSGTANTLNAESGVTIDGSNILSILGSGQQQLNVGSSNAGGAAIILDGDSNGDGAGGDYAIIRHNTDGDLEFYARNAGGATNYRFRSGTSETVRITNTGQLLIGSSSSANSGYKLESYSGGAYNIMARSTNGNGGYHNFTGQASNGTITSYITHNGRGYFEDGVQFDSGGEVLNSYEEGTWTPTATGFTISATYSARYTRIGRICHVNCYLRSASGSGTSTQPHIGGLPFTSQGSDTYSYGAGRIGNGGHNNAAYDIVFQQNTNGTNVKLYVGDGGINESMMSNTHVIFSLVYEVA